MLWMLPAADSDPYGHVNSAVALVQRESNVRKISPAADSRWYLPKGTEEQTTTGARGV